MVRPCGGPEWSPRRNIEKFDLTGREIEAVKDAGGGETAKSLLLAPRSFLHQAASLLIGEGDGARDVGADRVPLDHVSARASTCDADAIALVPRDQVPGIRCCAADRIGVPRLMSMPSRCWLPRAAIALLGPDQLLAILMASAAAAVAGAVAWR